MQKIMNGRGNDEVIFKYRKEVIQHYLGAVR